MITAGRGRKTRQTEPVLPDICTGGLLGFCAVVGWVNVDPHYSKALPP